MPSVIPAMAGGKKVPTMPSTAWALTMPTKLCNVAMTMHPNPTSAAPAAIASRFCRSRSTIAPIGVCAAIAANPPADMATPIWSGPQWSEALR